MPAIFLATFCCWCCIYIQKKYSFPVWSDSNNFRVINIREFVFRITEQYSMMMPQTHTHTYYCWYMLMVDDGNNFFCFHSESEFIIKYNKYVDEKDVINLLLHLLWFVFFIRVFVFKCVCTSLVLIIFSSKLIRWCID